jgi:dienelactone hydrolase
MMRKAWTAALLAAGLLVAAPGARAQFAVPAVQMTDPAPQGRRIEDEGLIGNYYPPTGKRPAPGILLLGGSEGALGVPTTLIAKGLQAQGFAVLHLSYFRAPGQSPQLALVPLETFDRALAWVGRQPGVNGKVLAVVGGSKGAEAALLIGSRHPELKAVVAGMPSSVVWPGIDWQGQETRSSWSLAGKPLPDLAYGTFTPPRVASVYESGLTVLPFHPEAAIPIEKTSAPVLLVCGEADSLWPSCPMARQLKARDPDRLEVLAYPDAGHAVFGIPLPDGDPRMPGLAGLGGTPTGNNAARTDSWAKVTAFLHKHLGG